MLPSALQSPIKHVQGGEEGTSHPAVPLGLVLSSCSAPEPSWEPGVCWAQGRGTELPPQAGPCPGKGRTGSALWLLGPGKFNSLLPIFVLAGQPGSLEEMGQGEGSKHPLHSL